MSRNFVRIYAGDGVARDSLEDFQMALGEYNTSEISAEELRSTEWMNTCKLLVLPGGRDLPYCKDLHGKAVENIQAFLNNGGAFIATCAGAYFASSHVEFAKGTEIEVIGDRELSIFSGTSIGPYFKDFNYQKDTERWLRLKCCDNASREVFYHGGGYFETSALQSNATIIGSYKEGKAAMIKVDHQNNGVSLLSHVHFETEGCWPRWKEFIEKELDLRIRLAEDAPVENIDFYVC